jgi:hypothetical protein
MNTQYLIILGFSRFLINFIGWNDGNLLASYEVILLGRKKTLNCHLSLALNVNCPTWKMETDRYYFAWSDPKNTQLILEKKKNFFISIIRFNSKNSKTETEWKTFLFFTLKIFVWFF